jgi:hypothetical protein
MLRPPLLIDAPILVDQQKRQQATHGHSEFVSSCYNIACPSWSRARGEIHCRCNCRHLAGSVGIRLRSCRRWLWHIVGLDSRQGWRKCLLRSEYDSSLRPPQRLLPLARKSLSVSLDPETDILVDDPLTVLVHYACLQHRGCALPMQIDPTGYIDLGRCAGRCVQSFLVRGARYWNS